MSLKPMSNSSVGKGRQSHWVHAPGTPPDAELHYLLYLPNGSEANGEGRWPLVLFLHGAGERGQDLGALLKHGVPKKLEADDFPFIAISPQCPADNWWPSLTGSLKALLDEALATYPADPDRVYLTGLSMGGYGSWHLAVENPDSFAAVAPICGGGQAEAGFPDRVVVLKDVPIWAFHGELDDVVPCRESQVLIERLRQAGGAPRFTLYPDAKHDSWTRTYDDPEFYRWLLAQRRGANSGSAT